MDRGVKLDRPITSYLPLGRRQRLCDIHRGMPLCGRNIAVGGAFSSVSIIRQPSHESMYDLDLHRLWLYPSYPTIRYPLTKAEPVTPFVSSTFPLCTWSDPQRL